MLSIVNNFLFSTQIRAVESNQECFKGDRESGKLALSVSSPLPNRIHFQRCPSDTKSRMLWTSVCGDVRENFVEMWLSFIYNSIPVGCVRAIPHQITKKCLRSTARAREDLLSRWQRHPIATILHLCQRRWEKRKRATRTLPARREKESRSQRQLFHSVGWDSTVASFVSAFCPGFTSLGAYSLFRTPEQLP